MSIGRTTLILHGAWRLNRPQREVLINTIRRGLASLARRARKHLNIVLPMHRNARSGDLNLYFERGEHRQCPRYIILGESNTGVIDIQSHLDLCTGGPNPSISTRRFLTTDRLLGVALGNTSLHELGHFIANLDHVRNSLNYMSTIGPPRAQRNIRTQRAFWAGQKSWNRNQERALIEGLRTGNYLGDFQIF